MSEMRRGLPQAVAVATILAARGARRRYAVLMCGIAGIIGRDATVQTAQAMSARIAHRGPDGDGIWQAAGVALAHRRLAILDPTAAGAQPMQLGAHVLTYNGELYNFHALRASIDVPLHSNCDTEVLLHLLARDGTAPFEKAVRGMLPKGVLGREMITKLKLYTTPDHPHAAQKPLPLPSPSRGGGATS